MVVEMKLGGQIREHREAMGLSQDDLAGRLFVSRQTVSNWETGHTYPDVQNLLLLGNLFDITLDELVKGDVEKMDEEIRRNRRRILFLVVVQWALVVFLTAYVFFDSYTHGRYWKPYWSMVVIPVGLICIGVGVYSEKLQKKADIATFRELLSYISGKPVDRTHRNSILSLAAGVLVAVIVLGIDIWLGW
ncbi:helix-turn-helix transcriptional regulator [Bifidobacterium sp. ESL0763]|uniref:helix-turn-helix domain-containing protein n=1 Tax=Bifidobacterium sp. ESL0763 TaxID=2983227 RepID=UPI0023F7C184|nr:helix-turn-helix transcriptional regulator [Bifidobacterium sp. ESL0763]MDF7663218.1 helix-turn-helix transcriptional regulator [Bifidobacterium sp. ESL0763]